MHVKEIFDRQPPERLYHYTTQHGLLGIVEKREIWASHTQYLNDIREFRHALSLAEEELANMNRQGSYEKRESELLDEMQKALDGVENINVCVCSFSENGDDLSQWRAYGGTSGFSLGFSGAFLKTISANLRFWLVPVVYVESQQRALVRTLLEDVLAENVARLDEAGPSKSEDDGLAHPLGGNLVPYLYRYAPILKHQSFSEEKEWRIISRPLFSSHERFAYRPGASMLIPYFRIPLESDGHPMKIEEVVVGPTPYLETSALSVRGLLAGHDLQRTSVRNSDVPYRKW
jgi:hypothetical protein